MARSATLQTVYRSNPETNYTKISNSILRINLIGDKLNAHSILLFALSCKPDWIFTTESIARHFNLINSESTKKQIRNANDRIRSLIQILIDSQYCERVKVKDPATGCFTMHKYLFYESPHARKKLYLASPPKVSQITANADKNPCTEKTVHGSLIINKKKNYDPCATAPGPVVVNFEIKKQAIELWKMLPVCKQKAISIPKMQALIEAYDFGKAKAFIRHVLSSSKVRDPVAMILAAISHKNYNLTDPEAEKKQEYAQAVEKLNIQKQLTMFAKQGIRCTDKQRYIEYKQVNYPVGEAGEVEINGNVYGSGQVADFIRRHIFKEVTDA